MQVHKVTITILDFDRLGAAEIKSTIENARYPNRCINPVVFDIESVDIGEWDDDHPLNCNQTADAEWRRLFPVLDTLKGNSDE